MHFRRGSGVSLGRLCLCVEGLAGGGVVLGLGSREAVGDGALVFYAGVSWVEGLGMYVREVKARKQKCETEGRG